MSADEENDINEDAMEGGDGTADVNNNGGKDDEDDEDEEENPKQTVPSTGMPRYKTSWGMWLHCRLHHQTYWFKTLTG